MTTVPIVLITRPKAQAQRFAAQCRGAVAVEFDTVLSPVLRIETVASPDLGRASGVIFTSENGVLAVADRARAVPAYCVGVRTASAAAEAGFVARAAGGSASQLFAMIKQANPQGALFHLRGAHQTGDLVGDLRAAGIAAEGHVVYEQHEQTLTQRAIDLLHGTGQVILPLFSIRSAQLVLGQTGALAESVHVVAISPGVAAACCDHVKSISTAKSPDADGMIAEISRRIVA